MSFDDYSQDGATDIDLEARVGFRRGMTEAALTDQLMRLGFRRVESEIAAGKVYAARVTALRRSGWEMILTGGLIALAAGVAFLMLVGMGGEILGHLVVGSIITGGLFQLIMGVERVSSARANAGKPMREKPAAELVSGRRRG